MTAPLPKDARMLAVMFAGSGVIHLVHPETFEPLMPEIVPAHRELIYASGVAELLCAAGMLHPATRRAAGWASAALLLAVYPGNLKMAGDAMKSRNQKAKAISLARLPLQIPLVRAAIRAARSV